MRMKRDSVQNNTITVDGNVLHWNKHFSTILNLELFCSSYLGFREAFRSQLGIYVTDYLSIIRHWY